VGEVGDPRYSLPLEPLLGEGDELPVRDFDRRAFEIDGTAGTEGATPLEAEETLAALRLASPWSDLQDPAPLAESFLVMSGLYPTGEYRPMTGPLRVLGERPSALEL